MTITPVAPQEVDALVIGAGPVGLFQVFQLGLLGLHCHVVDALPQAGGQCLALYPDKPIYDIPAVPVCTGAELTAGLLRQVEPFKPQFHFNREVSALQALDDGRFLIESGEGAGRMSWLARCVFIAAGVGAFQPRRLKLAGAEAQLQALEGGQILYHAPAVWAVSGAHVVVQGGDDRALAWVIELGLRIASAQPDAPASVTLLHRRDVYAAEPARVEQLLALEHAGAVHRRVGQPTGLQCDHDGRLTALGWVDINGQQQTLPADLLCVSLGLSPRLGPITQWGLALEQKHLAVDTACFETSVPGIYAVGDINTYPGKKKLIVCGFHEATLAAHAAIARLEPAQPHPLQYTTSSALLQQRLGVRPESVS